MVARCRQAALSATVARCRWATVPLLPPPTLLGPLLKYLEFSSVFPINVLYVYTGLAFSQPRCGRLVMLLQFFNFSRSSPPVRTCSSGGRTHLQCIHLSHKSSRCSTSNIQNPTSKIQHQESNNLIILSSKLLNMGAILRWATLSPELEMMQVAIEHEKLTLHSVWLAGSLRK